MAHHYDALKYEGHYSFTIAFPHDSPPSELGEVYISAVDRIHKTLGRVAPGYCVKVGEVSCSRLISNGDSDWHPPAGIGNE